MTSPWDYANEDYRPDTVEEIDEAIERVHSDPTFSNLWVTRGRNRNGQNIITVEYEAEYEGDEEEDSLSFESVRDLEEWIDANIY